MPGLDLVDLELTAPNRSGGTEDLVSLECETALRLRPRAGGNWKYVTNYVGYNNSAEQATGGIFRAATEGINAERSR